MFALHSKGQTRVGTNLLLLQRGALIRPQQLVLNRELTATESSDRLMQLGELSAGIALLAS